MRAFVINLDSATDRWTFVQQSFAGSQLVLYRISAIDATTLGLPHAQYSERLYRWFHGRTPNVRELACYLSHLKAMETFLATDEKHALIGEDDLVLRPDFDAAIEAAMQYARSWNILRVTGLSHGHPWSLVRLCGPYSLCVSLGRLKGAGAYVIDRGRGGVSRRAPPDATALRPRVRSRMGHGAASGMHLALSCVPKRE
jgi:glycosyl transferase family 25